MLHVPLQAQLLLPPTDFVKLPFHFHLNTFSISPKPSFNHVLFRSVLLRLQDLGI